MLSNVTGPGERSPRRILSLVVALAFAFQILPVASFAAPQETTNLKGAIELYDFAEFDQAIDSLRSLLDEGTLSTADQVRAWDYLGRAYVKRDLGGDRENAKAAFQSMLRLDPDRVLTDLEVPPDIVQVFDEARAEMSGGKAAQPAGEEPKEEFDFSKQATMKAEGGGGTDIVSVALLGGTALAGVFWIVANGNVSSKNDDIESALANGTINLGLYADAEDAASGRDFWAATTIVLAAATAGYYVFVKKKKGQGFFSSGLDRAPSREEGRRVLVDLNVRERHPYLGLSVSF